MKRMLLWTLVAALCGLSPAAWTQETAAQSGAKQYGDATRGQGVVEMWCVSCHAKGAVVDDRIPSLAALAANQRSDGAICAFLMQPHKPMPPLEISTQQIEDIVAYLHTLKPTAR